MKNLIMNIGNFETKKNNTNELSEVLNLKAQINETMQIDSKEQARMRLTAYELISNKNIITGENEITLKNKFVKLDRLEDCIVLQLQNNKKKLKILEVDVLNKKIKFESTENLSSQNIDVYYLPADGSFQILYEPTGGSSTVRKVFFRGTFAQIHQKDQYRDLGVIIPNRVIFPNWKLKIYVKTEAEINFNNELAFVDIPVIYYEAGEFMNILVNKGYTVEQLKKVQLLKDN